ncbi:Uncharacterized protein Fot_10634 [Forsythia ovata]|uniref:Uncharacterized protein n=1 Tax=Forsythia ovata TaxID=205694 RepID=A0ABD1WHD7_9LAMI
MAEDSSGHQQRGFFRPPPPALRQRHTAAATTTMATSLSPAHICHLCSLPLSDSKHWTIPYNLRAHNPTPHRRYHHYHLLPFSLFPKGLTGEQAHTTTLKLTPFSSANKPNSAGDHLSAPISIA